MIPKGARVRRTFTFDLCEKNPFQSIVSTSPQYLCIKRFISTDCFFSIAPVENRERLQHIFNRANKETVEIEVHPENAWEIDFILSDNYQDLFNSVKSGSFQQLLK